MQKRISIQTIRFKLNSTLQRVLIGTSARHLFCKLCIVSDANKDYGDKAILNFGVIFALFIFQRNKNRNPFEIWSACSGAGGHALHLENERKKRGQEEKRVKG